MCTRGLGGFSAISVGERVSAFISGQSIRTILGAFTFFFQFQSCGHVTALGTREFPIILIASVLCYFVFVDNAHSFIYLMLNYASTLYSGDALG